MAGRGTNLLVICYHKWTLDGFSVLVKYLQLNIVFIGNASSKRVMEEM